MSPIARPALPLIALALVVIVAACGASDRAAQRSSSAAASVSAASSAAASAAAARASDNAQLAAWLTKEQADLTLAGQFGASMSLTETENSTQQAALAASCGAAADAQAGAATFPVEAAKRQSRQVAPSDTAQLTDSLKQTAAFCALYDTGLQHELKIEADYAAFDQAYFYSGKITVEGKTYSCSSRCLTPDVSRYPAAADAYQAGATEAAMSASAFSSAPSPFSGAGWAQLWSALGQRLVQFGTYDTSYIAALRAQSAAGVTSSRQALGAYTTSSEATINQQIAALNLFPAGIVSGYTAAAGGGVAAQLAYYGRYQLGVLTADDTSAMTTISAALR